VQDVSLGERLVKLLFVERRDSSPAKRGVRMTNKEVGTVIREKEKECTAGDPHRVAPRTKKQPRCLLASGTGLFYEFKKT